MALRVAPLTLTLWLLAAWAPAAQAAPHVLIIGIDGCRGDAIQAAQTPNLDLLVADGAYSWQARTSFPSSSGPGWSSMLTSVWPPEHHVFGNDFYLPNYDAYPHFFKRLDAIWPDAQTASIVHWTPINTQILGDDADVVRSDLSDTEVAEEAVSVLRLDDPDVVFLHFDDVDHAGHTYGFSPFVSEYTDAIEIVDGLIGQVLAGLRARPSYPREDWLVVVSSDHGGLGTGHGGPSDREMDAFLILNGPGVQSGELVSEVFVVDVPATVFDFLGLEVDPAWGWHGVSRGLR